jgi:pSer/pThr/pTyr-binding forkhead associated (FHA) protein
VGTGANTAPVAPNRVAPITNSGSLPPPLPSSGGTSPAARAGALPSLYVIFNGQKIPVNKEEFVIGRGSKTADLPIKDGNISRRHAAIVFQNGGFFMKDLGSTNGIEFAGERVDVKRIEEGDIYQLCDYELRFTYR